MCLRTAKALVRLHGCAVSPEPSLVACVVSTIFSWAGSYDQGKNSKYGQNLNNPVQTSDRRSVEIISIAVVVNDKCYHF